MGDLGDAKVATSSRHVYTVGDQIPPYSILERGRTEFRLQLHDGNLGGQPISADVTFPQVGLQIDSLHTYATQGNGLLGLYSST